MAKTSIRDPVYDRLLARYPGLNTTEAVAALLAIVELMEKGLSVTVTMPQAASVPIQITPPDENA